MAEQDEVNTPTPERWYMSAVPTSNGNLSGQGLQRQPAGHSLYEIQINPANPNQAALLPAPGADGRLLNAFDHALMRAFTTNRLPGREDKFLAVEKPTLLEKVGDNWKITEQGRVGYTATEPEQRLQVFGQVTPQATQQAELTTRAEELASEVATTVGTVRTEAEAELEVVANRAQQGPDESRATYADGLRDEARAELDESTDAPERQQPVGEGQSREQPPVAPAPDTAASTEPVGELRITWQQKGDEVAPLLEMRAYLDQLKEAGVAVGALQLARDPAGKLSGGFAVSYDPESHKLGQLEAALQGFRQVGNGMAVVERPEQAAARRQEVGYDDDYEPQRSKQVREAFGVKQWDALSAQLSAVPKHALTAPEQVQQAAAGQRVQQLAQQQGKTTEQVIRDGKSIFDIDTSGNPASAFLKNFYAHLNGGPKTRQNLEVDYEKTRQDLQARLTRHAGAAQPELLPGPPAPDAKAPAVAAEPGVEAARQTVAGPAPSAALFKADEVPQKVLASLGLNLAELTGSGQLQKLLSGEKTDLLPMQVAGKEGQEPVKFEGKMVLHREADGTATLKMELPQEKLVIPNEIGGQPFTPEQRQRLETEGNAGLVRGLKDEQGREFNGYVAVDKAMNKVVVLPESKVTLHDTVAGVKLTPEQSHDLREGKVVALANMASGNGGQKFDGTVQVNAAKACIEVKPAAHELGKRQAPRAEQTVKATTPTMAPAPVKAEAPQVKTRGPRH
ncbi:DUF3945 domain-containing protein [Hymenobacter properus]|uniref:DUF3945 domain-containing protein n=1 Tax=Hymenobacter properus TaxID=2791026 RepID=A0A931BLE1_9BACT|nr:DUF3945 domain-containing protein [Hymenobacter properus]MBF9144452.1 DUF3945 domain-containing protein [Hymenobacter properus]MBR7723270.1 DUF3945 domain-containing protein [Microvirga sp. SRT04]